MRVILAELDPLPMHSMRIRLITAVSATVLNLLLVFAGYYWFGPVCALGFGATFGIAIFIAASWIFRQERMRRKHRRQMIAVMVFAVSVGTLLAVDAYRDGLHETRARMRAADRIRTKLQSQRGYEYIIISYDGPPLHLEERLSVHGYVKSPADMSVLQEMIYKDKDWNVDWDVSLLKQ